METTLAQLSLEEFAARVASQEPTPGGGSVSAAAGSLAAALGAMVWRLTGAKGLSALPEARLDELAEELAELGAALAANVDRDAQSYEGVLAALRLPKESDEEKRARGAALQVAVRTATEVPLETARLCAEVMDRCSAAAAQGHPGAVTDAAVGVLMAFAGLQGALYNVQINLGDLTDDTYEAAVSVEMEGLRTYALDAWSAVDASVRSTLAPEES